MFLTARANDIEASKVVLASEASHLSKYWEVLFLIWSGSYLIDHCEYFRPLLISKAIDFSQPLPSWLSFCRKCPPQLRSDHHLVLDTDISPFAKVLSPLLTKTEQL